VHLAKEFTTADEELAKTSNKDAPAKKAREDKAAKTVKSEN